MRLFVSTVQGPIDNLWSKKTLNIVGSLSTIFDVWGRMFQPPQQQKTPTTTAAEAAAAAGAAAAAAVAAVAAAAVRDGEQSGSGNGGGSGSGSGGGSGSGNEGAGGGSRATDDARTQWGDRKMGIPLEDELTELDDAIFGMFHNIATIDEGLWINVVRWAIHTWNGLTLDIRVEPLLDKLSHDERQQVEAAADGLVKKFRQSRRSRRPSRGDSLNFASGNGDDEGEGEGKEGKEEKEGEEGSEGKGGITAEGGMQGAKPRTPSSNHADMIIALDSPILTKLKPMFRELIFRKINTSVAMPDTVTGEVGGGQGGVQEGAQEGAEGGETKGEEKAGIEERSRASTAGSSVGGGGGGGGGGSGDYGGPGVGGTSSPLDVDLTMWSSPLLGGRAPLCVTHIEILFDSECTDMLTRKGYERLPLSTNKGSLMGSKT